MTSAAGRSPDPPLRDILRSARADAPRPGAKARAVAHLTEASQRAWRLSGPMGGAVVAAAIAILVTSGILDRAPLAVSPPDFASGCLVGVEAPPGSCGELGREGSESSGAAGASSSGVAGSSGRSSSSSG